jgi:hypothetical protein
MGGWHSIGIEYHGPPLDDDGKPIPGLPDIHVRVMLGADEDDDLPSAIFQLDSVEDLSHE